MSELFSQEHADWQQEYEQRVFIFSTDFKNGFWIRKPGSKFHKNYFKGTQKQYDEEIEMYFNHENGKIIGTQKFDSIEEFKSIKRISQRTIDKISNPDKEKVRRKESYRYLSSKFR